MLNLHKIGSNEGINDGKCFNELILGSAEERFRDVKRRISSDENGIGMQQSGGSKGHVFLEESSSSENQNKDDYLDDFLLKDQSEAPLEDPYFTSLKFNLQDNSMDKIKEEEDEDSPRSYNRSSEGR